MSSLPAAVYSQTPLGKVVQRGLPGGSMASQARATVRHYAGYRRCSMIIQVSEKHIGPTATLDQANMVIRELKRMGWPVKYCPPERVATWSFDSLFDLQKFEDDFHQVREGLFKPYIWRLSFPAECKVNQQVFACGRVDEMVMERRRLDYQAVETPRRLPPMVKAAP